MNNIYLKKERRNIIIIVLIQIFLLITFILLWEIFAKNKIIDSFLFSSPSEIYKIFKVYINDGSLFKHITISLLETLLGLFIGTILGIIIAIILWWYQVLAKILMPFLIVFNALPKTALAPIIIIWVGTGIDGITVVAISIAIVMTIITTYTNFSLVDIEKIKMMKSFKATKLQILIHLVIPANFINIISTIKINIGLTWVGVIVGEFLVSKAGIGYLIVYGTQVFKLDIVMMGMVILCVISFLMYEIVNIIEKHLIKKRGI